MKELAQMEYKQVFEVVKLLPPGFRLLPSHFVLKIKRHADGTFDKYKARLVAGGHRQDPSMYSL